MVEIVVQQISKIPRGILSKTETCKLQSPLSKNRKNQVRTIRFAVKNPDLLCKS